MLGFVTCSVTAFQLSCGLDPSAVMAGLDPAIYEAGQHQKPKGCRARRFIVDARVKPAHDV